MTVHSDDPDGLSFLFNVNIAFNFSFDIVDGYIISEVSVMVECPLDNFPALKRFLMGVKINKMLDLLRLFSIQICQLRIIESFPQRFMMNGSMEGII